MSYKSTAPLERPEIHLTARGLSQPRQGCPFAAFAPSTSSVDVGHVGSSQELVSQPNGEAFSSVVNLIIVERASALAIGTQPVVRSIQESNLSSAIFDQRCDKVWLFVLAKISRARPLHSRSHSCLEHGCEPFNHP